MDPPEKCVCACSHACVCNANPLLRFSLNQTSNQIKQLNSPQQHKKGFKKNKKIKNIYNALYHLRSKENLISHYYRNEVNVDGWDGVYYNK